MASLLAAVITYKGRDRTLHFLPDFARSSRTLSTSSIARERV